MFYFFTVIRSREEQEESETVNETIAVTEPQDPDKHHQVFQAKSKLSSVSAIYIILDVRVVPAWLSL